MHFKFIRKRSEKVALKPTRNIALQVQVLQCTLHSQLKPKDP